MVSLITHQELQAVRALPYCYLCDKNIAERSELSKDHVPPKTVFAKPDRRPLQIFGDGVGAVLNVDLDGAVWRWVRGFHAALYREYLPVVASIRWARWSFRFSELQFPRLDHWSLKR